MDEEKKLLEEKKEGAIDWSEFKIERVDKEDNPTGQLDADLKTPVKITDIPAPNTLVAGAPDKPKMMEYLTSYQSAKITKKQYLEQLKSYAESKTLIFKDQLERTIEAHKILTEASLQGVHEKIRAWAQDITVVTDLSLQDSITKAIGRAAEIANSALKNLAKMDNPHPAVQQTAMKSVIETMERTVANIKSGGAKIKDRNLDWRPKH